MAIIGVDVDLTVVPSDRMWFDWCNAKCRKKLNLDDLIEEHGQVPYDFGKLFGFFDPVVALDFWWDEGIYDDIDPLNGAVEALEILSAEHDIVFVSKLMGNHYHSKSEMIKRHFPFAAGFIGTDHKHYARVDLLIDDRVDHLNRVQRHGIKPIQYMTPYHQDEEPATDMPFIKSWTDVLCTDADVLYNALFTNIRKAEL